MNAMKINMMQHIQRKEGVTLLVALLLVGVLLGISTSLLNVSLKQYQLAGIAYSSEIAFQAANAGMECALYHDFPVGNASSTFAVPAAIGVEQIAVPEVNCANSATKYVVDYQNGVYNDGDTDGMAISGEEQHFQFDLPAPVVCVDVSVYKFKNDTNPVPRTVNGNSIGGSADCPANSECTIIQSRGYNVDCTTVNAGTNPRTVEREYTLVY